MWKRKLETSKVIPTISAALLTLLAGVYIVYPCKQSVYYTTILLLLSGRGSLFSMDIRANTIFLFLLLQVACSTIDNLLQRRWKLASPRRGGTKVLFSQTVKANNAAPMPNYAYMLHVCENKTNNCWFPFCFFLVNKFKVKVNLMGDTKSTPC